MNLSVVIPARNEGGNIGNTLENLIRRLDRESLSFELIAVDDGSEDDTIAEIERRASSDDRIRLLRNEGPHGFGRTVRLGLKAASGDAVVITMADGSDDPDDVAKYYHVLCDQADCAFGSRWVHGGSVEDYPPLKRVLNRIGNTFIRLLFGLRYNDMTTAFKGYRKEVIQGCRPFLSPHFNLTVELPLKAIVRGYSYVVVPIGWRSRKAGVSRFSAKEMGSRYLYIILNVWLERLLTRGDYQRPQGERFRPWEENSK